MLYLFGITVFLKICSKNWLTKNNLEVCHLKMQISALHPMIRESEARLCSETQISVLLTNSSVQDSLLICIVGCGPRIERLVVGYDEIGIPLR